MWRFMTMKSLVAQVSFPSHGLPDDTCELVKMYLQLKKCGAWDWENYSSPVALEWAREATGMRRYTCKPCLN